MCKSERIQLESFSQSPSFASMAIPAAPPATKGSRRRRLWELDGHAHCPVLGVCLPIAALRRLADKVQPGQMAADDYELHCAAVADCKFRSPLAELVQRELDRRYAPSIGQAARPKTTESLAAWWAGALCGQDIAGALWATLTHSRCTPELAKQVEGAVHMLQHQAGMAARIDGQRFVALMDENAVLARELGDAQQRVTRNTAEHTRRSEVQKAELVRLRAELIGRDTVIGALREDLQMLEAETPDVRSRLELAREVALLVERCHELQRLLLQAQQESERHRRRANHLSHELQRSDAADAESVLAAVELPIVRFDDRAVLCVGGRPGSVPAYRQLIERTGGRFLHHDGGQEDNSAQLDSTLAAADLVICQTGCISHGAYWRVKDHCKRTGKQCVFVETPSTAGLKRALLALSPAAEQRVGQESPHARNQGGRLSADRIHPALQAVLQANLGEEIDLSLQKIDVLFSVLQSALQELTRTQSRTISQCAIPVLDSGLSSALTLQAIHARERRADDASWRGGEVYVMNIPAEMGEAYARHGTKLAKALHYLHTKRITPSTSAIKVRALTDADLIRRRLRVVSYRVLIAELIRQRRVATANLSTVGQHTQDVCREGQLYLADRRHTCKGEAAEIDFPLSRVLDIKQLSRRKRDAETWLERE